MAETAHVAFKRRDGAVQITIDDPMLVAAAIGADALAAFYKCFMGAERILAFEHLMQLNRAAEKAETPLGDRQAFLRNHTILGVLLAGTMHEIGAALQELCNARVTASITVQPSWEPLNVLRKKWNTAAFASVFRNSFAYHLGDRDKYVKGLQSPRDRVVLFDTERGERLDGKFPEPWEALLRGLGIGSDQLSEFTANSRDAHTEYPRLLFEFFRAVLADKGVAFDAG